MKATEQYNAVRSFGIVDYAVQGGSNFESVDEILMCDHLNESYGAVLSCGGVYYAVQDSFNFSIWVCGWNPNRERVAIMIKMHR